jgi:hypothetical protein
VLIINKILINAHKKAINMKKILFILAITLMAFTAMAQTQKISYQAVVRDANNRLVTNTDVTVDVTITYGSNTYTETGLTATTNANGLFSLTIGNNTGFDAIDWSIANIKTKVSFNGKSIESTTGVTAIPHVLHANIANTVSSASPTMIDLRHLIDSVAIHHGKVLDTLKNSIP